MRYECIRAKTLLSKTRWAESWFHANRSLNAYKGCEHACAYCDGMSERYFVDDFTTHIRIKENAPQVLRRELLRSGFVARSGSLVPFLEEGDADRITREGPRKQVIGVCGGVSDGYQPAEKEHRITRKVLETLLDFRLPVFVLTKSDLVLQDLDLLKEIHKQAFVNICFSITLHDEETKAIFEPKSSATWERFEALKEIRRAGIHPGVMGMPMIPGIGDTYENMRGIAKEAKRVGAEFVQFSGMTLKPGRQKEYFLSVVRKQLPDKHDFLQQIFANDHPYGHPQWELLPFNIMIRGREVCREIGIRDRSVRHMLPSEPEPNVRVLRVLLDIEFYQSQMLGYPCVDWQPYQELAITIEQGVEDLEELRQRGRLGERLDIGPSMIAVVEEILDRGSCKVLDEILAKIDAYSGK
ncbi:MAG: radical SAM protein [Promethearchaeota archaeon]